MSQGDSKLIVTRSSLRGPKKVPSHSHRSSHRRRLSSGSGEAPLPVVTRNMIRFAVRRPWPDAQSIANDGLVTGDLPTATNPPLVSLILECVAGPVVIIHRFLR